MRMKFFFLLVLSLFPAMLEARGIGHKREVDEFIGQMVEAHGFDRTELENLFARIDHVETVVRLASPALSSEPKDWHAYRALFVNRIRIEDGVIYWNKYRAALSRASAKYGVPPEIIVAIIGVETLYGRHTGSFRVLDALSTLAFDYPETLNREARMAFFRGELENALVLARQEKIDPLSLYGSYAGAIGMPQFMPGSIMKYGIDFDGDGKIDLERSPVDAIGSVANFLVMHGWRKGEGLVYPVTIRSGNEGWKSIAGDMSARFSLKKLESSGVYPRGTAPELNFGLVDLQNGDRPAQYWLGTDNFFAIVRYNRSYYYAMSVVDLGEAVKKARSRAR